jgi:diguanylate cyclase (GGDEF)-like protein
LATGKSYSQPIFYIWNTLIEFISFLIVVFLLSEIRNILNHEKEIAHTDYLTGAINSRFFYDILQLEIRRSNRYKHPFTIAYFDIDNFKTLNDQFGHVTGDMVLRAVVLNARKHLRVTDVVARLGGDEFVVLLPETNLDAAKVALAKIQSDISEGMQQNNWPVTLSIGVLTCMACMESVKQTDEIIRVVDDLMYLVKRNGKNAIKYSNFMG